MKKLLTLVTVLLVLISCTYSEDTCGCSQVMPYQPTLNEPNFIQLDTHQLIGFTHYQLSTQYGGTIVGVDVFEDNRAITFNASIDFNEYWGEYVHTILSAKTLRLDNPSTYIVLKQLNEQAQYFSACFWGDNSFSSLNEDQLLQLELACENDHTVFMGTELHSGYLFSNLNNAVEFRNNRRSNS